MARNPFHQIRILFRWRSSAAPTTPTAGPERRTSSKRWNLCGSDTITTPNTAHKFHPDSKRESEEFIVKSLETAGQAPAHLRFVTYTARYNRCFWITVEELEHSYQRADVEATREATQTVINAKNVSRLKVAGPAGEYELDGQKVTAKASDPVFEKKNGRWSLQNGRAAGLQKIHGLQGPIDDAFMGPFLCVRPTGDAWNPAAQEYGKKTLDRLSGEFPKWMRGDPRVKDDRAVS